MKKLWVNPEDINIVRILNNRELDDDYIQSLAESMEQHGFLPEYPIEVFSTENIPLTAWHGNKPYVCACGAHRREAAIYAGIEAVLVEIFDGNEEDWIERMSLDNFKFDVAADSSIGQTFSQKEKRAACIQLLLLPKYMERTNTALADAWNTSEANVRRWRKEVASLIDEGSEKLQEFSVSDDRIERLKVVLASDERIDDDGKPVKVRRKAPEWTDDEKSDFWTRIRKDAGWHNDGWLKEHGIKDFDYVRAYLSKKYNIDDSYSMGEDMTTQQLRQVHSWILSDDPELIAGCKEIAEARDLIESRREDLRAGCSVIKKWLLDEFVQGNEYSQAYKACKAAFTDAARHAGHGDYCVEYYDYPGGENLAEKFKFYSQIAHAVHCDIIDEVDWIVEFRQKMETDITAKRQKLEKNWISAKQALADVFDAYPRNISIGAFCYALEDEFYEKSGTYLKLLNLKEPSNRVHNDTLKSQIKNFKQAAKDLKADAKWVRAIAEEPEASEPTQSIEDVLPGGKVLGIKLICSNNQHYWFEDDSLTPDAVPLSSVPEEILVKLLLLTKDIGRLDAAAGEFVRKLDELGLSDNAMLYALERACTHYSCDLQSLLMMTNLFPDRFDANAAEAYREQMVAPHVNAWINTLVSMSGDIETGENWMSRVHSERETGAETKS